MAHRYRDLAGERCARLSRQSARDRAVFEHSYDIAMQVVDLREQRGLSQAQLAELCGVDQADISRIERGSTSPTARTLQRIAEALGAELRLVPRIP